MNVHEKIYELIKSNSEGAICTITNTVGSTPREVGAKMLVDSNGNIFGTIGGGELERQVIVDSKEIIKSKTAKLFKHDLLNHHGMCCGGRVDIFIEPIIRKNKLYIFGAGHIGKALCDYLTNLGFEVFVIDERKELLNEIKADNINKMPLPLQQALPLLPFDDHTYIVIVTHSHSLDREILAFCIKKDSAYLGMIGSKRKVEVTKQKFMEAGVASDEELAMIDMPMGVNIDAEGPHEIAISILAKLIEVKNYKHKCLSKQ